MKKKKLVKSRAPEGAVGWDAKTCNATVEVVVFVLWAKLAIAFDLRFNLIQIIQVDFVFDFHERDTVAIGHDDIEF